jgi:uncharacterized protein YfaS (alpha-2-macroglobulin family)
MAMKRLSILLAILILFFGAAGLWLAIDHYSNLPQRVSAMETLVLGQTRYVPGSEAALHVVVRDISDQSPISNATVSVSLRPTDGGRAITLFNGTTTSDGVADINFDVPKDLEPDQEMIIETSSELGEDRLQQAITLERDTKILLSTDKPLYQPGQVIHLRALALSTFDLIPASEQDIEFSISDGKGNKVFRETRSSSEFGVAALDFQLATQVNTGPYKITAQMGNTTSEKTVTVERYVLPKFDLNWSTNQTFYRPGETVSGTLNAEYFFGKLVAGGEVLIETYTFDFERQDFFRIEGNTDLNGDFAFEFNLPDFIAGSDLEGGMGRVYLQATLTDLAKHTETSSYSLPVSQSEIIIEAIPESGVIRPGVENIFYILTSYPDGAPAASALQLSSFDGDTISLETGEYGLAEYRFTPQEAWFELEISARDAQGALATNHFTFESSYEPESVLLRPDRAVYQVGDTMRLDVLTSSAAGRAYLDIVREGQTVSTRTIEITNGQGAVAIDLSADLFGTLELHAYKILPTGTIVRDTRLVVVDAPSNLSLTLTPDQAEYLPGDLANLGIQVNDAEGKGAQAAIGLAIVDESVFALAEQDPGFAKLYFMLEAELLQPKYEIHGFSVPDLLEETPQQSNLQDAVEGAAQASLAEASAQRNPFTLQLNSRELKIELARERQSTFFSNLTRVLFGIELLIPIAAVTLVGVSLARRRVFAVSSGLLVGLFGGIILAFFLIPAPDWVGIQPLERLSFFADQLRYMPDGAALAVLISGPLAFLLLAIYTIRNRDWFLLITQILTVLFIPLAIVLILAFSESDLNPSQGLTLAALLMVLLLPLSFLLRGAGFSAEKKFGWALISVLVVPILIVLPLAASPVYSLTGALGFNNAAMRGDVVFEAMDMQEVPLAVIDQAMAAPEAEAAEQAVEGSSAGEPPRLRQYFPETMFWLPEAVTDENGTLQLEVPIADSITTWRMTAMASTQDGRLGTAEGGLRVFQDFFIDLDLPLALTQNDEISVPVGIFNYLTESQTVTLTLEQAGWFELLDEAEKQITIAANDIDVVYFRIKARAFGRHPLKVTAIGSRLSDAIQKEVQVYPDGKLITFSTSDRLPADGTTQQVEIPTAAIPGTQSLTVKIYPGIVSQVVEGLDSILRMPYGCFEQTSSTTYPNVLVLDYLQTTAQASPETQFKAEEYINLGYQRLTTFEVGNSGGFSLFGDPPPDPMLTAYGLQEFTDMSRVHNVDPALITRSAEWLLAQQSSDGSWEGQQGFHETSLTNQTERLPVTAFVVWGLVEAGYGDDAQVEKGLDYLQEFQSQSEDPYVLALIANAFVSADLPNGQMSSRTQALLDRLAGMAEMDGEAAFWSSLTPTFMGSEGQTGDIETTAMAALALIRGSSHPQLANAALTYIIRQKDSFGTWYSTQATVMSLKALIETVRSQVETVDASVTISLNGGQTRTLSVTPETFDIIQTVTFDDVNPGAISTITLEVEGDGNLMYQVSGGYYLPWQEVINSEPDGLEPLSIEVNYDRTEMNVDDSVGVNVSVTMNDEGTAEWALIDLGIPPGFSVMTEDLNALIARYDDVPEDYAFPTIERYELTGRQILVYIANLSNQQPLSFDYRLKAEFPLVAQTPASSVYDYYNPDVNGEQAPLAMVVNP